MQSALLHAQNDQSLTLSTDADSVMSFASVCPQARASKSSTGVDVRETDAF